MQATVQGRSSTSTSAPFARTPRVESNRKATHMRSGMKKQIDKAYGPEYDAEFVGVQFGFNEETNEGTVLVMRNSAKLEKVVYDKWEWALNGAMYNWMFQGTFHKNGKAVEQTDFVDARRMYVQPQQYADARR